MPATNMGGAGATELGHGGKARKAAKSGTLPKHVRRIHVQPLQCVCSSRQRRRGVGMGSSVGAALQS
jgi:hypothetical protein